MDAETKEQFRELRAENEKTRAEYEMLVRELWADLSAAIRGSEVRLTARFDARFDALESRLAALELRVANLETELATLKRVTVESFARVQRNFQLVLAEVRDPAKQARIDRIEERLARLERHVGLPDE